MPFDNTCPISQKNNTYCQQCLLGETLLYFYMNMPSNHRHRWDPLWPGMKWNSSLKYVYCSKYSLIVSQLQLSFFFFSSALLSGFIWHLFSFPEREKRRVMRLVSHKCYSSFSCICWSRAVLSMLNGNFGQKQAVKVSRTCSFIKSQESLSCKHLMEHEWCMSLYVI